MGIITEVTMNDIDLSAIKKILVTRTDRIGDVILSTPVFQALKKTFPHVSLYALVLPTTRALLDGNPFIDKIITYDKRGKHKSLWKTITFARSLREEKIDIALHLHPTNRVHSISRIAGIPVRIGYKKKNHWLLTHSQEERKWEGMKHEAEYNFDLLRYLQVEPPHEIKPYFLIGQKDEAAFDALLEREHISLSSYVVLFPSASCPSKMWPLKNFVHLSEMLYTKYNKEIVLIGGADDIHIAEKVKKQVTIPVVDVTGKLSLKMLGALLKRSCLLISNDSGPVHIAASLDTPVISIFGRSDSGLSPQRWGPLGKMSYFIHKDVGCVECRAHNCEKDFLCLQSITVQDVCAIIEKERLLA